MNINEKDYTPHEPKVGEHWRYNNGDSHYFVKVIDVDDNKVICVPTNIVSKPDTQQLCVDVSFNASIKCRDYYLEHTSWQRVSSFEDIYEALTNLLLDT